MVFLLVAVVLDESSSTLRRGNAVDLILGDSDDVGFMAEGGVNGGAVGGAEHSAELRGRLLRHGKAKREKEVVTVYGRNRQGNGWLMFDLFG